MNTKRVYTDIENPDTDVLEEAAKLLRAGELVAFPTETVYGLGADALNPEACSNIFRVKGRPQDNPLITHVSSKEMAVKLVKTWTPVAELCAKEFWPGPLTLVLQRSNIVSDVVTAGLNTVAIRMPSHPVALALIEYTGRPIAAPSANLSGKPSPTLGSHVWEDMQGKIPMIVDSGQCDVGLESTVLDISGEIPVILRPGGVTKEQLEDVLGEVRLEALHSNQAPKAPGMKYKHYSPEGEVVVLVGTRGKILTRMSEEIKKAQLSLKKVGILCTSESAPYIHEQLPDLLFVLGSEARLEEVAGSLFEGLRLCDERQMDIIFVEGFDTNKGIGVAIMNRLEKAADKKILKV